MYGHVKAQQSHTSRIPNGRWNMPSQQHYKDHLTSQLPKNMQPATHFAINTNQIKIISTEPELWDCAHLCAEQGNVRNLLIHDARKRPGTSKLDIKFHYCPFAFRNIGYVKIHLRNQTCPNIHYPKRKHGKSKPNHGT